MIRSTTMIIAPCHPCREIVAILIEINQDYKCHVIPTGLIGDHEYDQSVSSRHLPSPDAMNASEHQDLISSDVQAVITKKDV